MSTQIQRRRGTTAQHASFTGAVGETTIDTDKEVVVVHDGVQVGGYPQMRENGSNSALALGSAGTPSLKFTGDTNTGIYSPGADQVAISTGGSGRLFINSAGNVGIGAANTGAAFLEVGGSLRWQTQGIFRNSTNTSTLLRFAEIGSRDVRLDTWDGTDFNGTIRHGAQTYLVETGTGSSLTERLRITSAGLVGIGTSSPGAELDVRGAINVGNSTSTVRIIGDNTYGYVGTSSNHPLVIRTNNSSAITVDTSQRVGIGTTSPAVTGLTIENASATQGLELEATNGFAAGPTVRGYYRTGSAYKPLGITGSQVIFGIQDVEKARIDSSGRLLVGTSSAATTDNNANSPYIQLDGTGGDTSRLLIRCNADTTPSQGPVLYLSRSRGTTANSKTAVAADDLLGTIIFEGTDGTHDRRAAAITAFCDGGVSTNDMPGRLVFSVTRDGESSPTGRFWIVNNGYSYFQSTGQGVAFATTQGAGTTTEVISAGHSATGGTYNSITTSFKVWSNGNVQNTNNSYTAISDIKLKENIVDANSQWDDIKALQVRNYNLKEGQTHKQIGLIAQEVEPISPGLVYESPDRDAEGNGLGTVTKSVNYSVLYMKAVKALQEAMERIEQLEAKVAALETA